MDLTDSPEPFLYRLSMGVLLSLAAAALMPVDVEFDGDDTSGSDPGSH